MLEALTFFAMAAAGIWLVISLIRYFVFPPGGEQAEVVSRPNNPSRRLAARIEAYIPPNAPLVPINDPNERIEKRAVPAPRPAPNPASFMIEYTDAYGSFTRRRITVEAIQKASDGTPMLYAQCHERNEPRNFRIDRIKSCIDYDGVVHDDVEAFLNEAIGLKPHRIRRIATGHLAIGPTSKDWNAKREMLRPYVTILTALALADGGVDPPETEKIIDFCKEMGARHRKVIGGDEDKLRRYIKRMRPAETNLDTACSKLATRSLADRRLLFRTADELARVDGKVDDVEIAFLEDLRAILDIDLTH